MEEIGHWSLTIGQSKIEEYCPLSNHQLLAGQQSASAREQREDKHWPRGEGTHVTVEEEVSNMGKTVTC